MDTNEFEALSWDELDDNFGMISAGDTADLSGVVTLADDGFFDGIDYVSPVEDLKRVPALDDAELEIEPDDDFPPYIPPKQEVVEVDNSSDPTGPLNLNGRTAAASEVIAPKQVQIQSGTPRSHMAVEDSSSSWAGIIIAIILALAILGGLIWFFVGAGGCSAITEEPTQSQNAATDEDDKKDDDEDNKQTTPVADDKDDKSDQKEDEKQDEADTKQEEEQKAEERPSATTEPEQPADTQETTQPEQTDKKWVEEQRHWEPQLNWVVDVQGGQPIYETKQVKVGTKQVLVSEGYWNTVTEAWDETKIDAEGNEYTEHHDAVQVWVDPVYTTEDVYETQQVITGYTQEQGHWEGGWVVDVEGHWE